MATSTTSVFTEIVKTEKQVDGTLKVWGKATGPDLDSDLQICDPEWLAKEMPSWMQWGNVREMHGKTAAGVGTFLEQDGDNWNLETLVVDPSSVAKIENGVLKGYSIGIASPKVVKDVAAPGGRIVGGTIVEVSLVDRPANPTCSVMIAKMVGSDLVGVEDIVKMDNSPDALAGEAGTEADVTADMDGDGDAAEDADYVATARAALVAWLASEAGEVADGTGGTFVVRMILDLLDGLCDAEMIDGWDDEAAALAAVKAVLAEGPKEPEMLKLAQVADLVKAAQADDASTDDKTAVTVLRKALGLDDTSTELAEVTKTAQSLQTKVNEQDEIIKGLAAELVKVGEMAAPGGPMRVVPQQKQTANAEIMAKAANMRSIGRDLVDRNLARQYELAAAELEASIQ